MPAVPVVEVPAGFIARDPYGGYQQAQHHYGAPLQPQMLPVGYGEEQAVAFQPPKPRKQLVYKSKTGESIDIGSFKKPAPAELPAIAAAAVVDGAVEPNVGAEVVAASAPSGETGKVSVPAEPSLSVPVVPAAPSVTVIVEPIQALRILSPTMEDAPKESLQSPVVKNINIPVTLSSAQPSFSISKASSSRPSNSSSPTAAAEAVSASPVTVAPATTSAGNAAPRPAVKKTKKEMYAAADAATGGDLLSAYTDDSAAVEPPAAETRKDVLTLAQTPSPVDETPDSWEDDSTTPVIAAEPKGRSLRPGGMKSGSSKQPPTRLNTGYMPKKYSKQELLALRPPPETRSPLNCYENFTSVSEGSTGGGGKGPSGTPTGGGGANQWGKQQQRDSPRVSGGQQDSGQHDQQGGAGWKRDSNLPPAMQQGGGRGGKRAPPTNVPMPKKQISDPMELLTTEVLAILNKITPQTLEKLSARILSIPLVNTAMLDKLIELIFEKAVQEPAFSVTYADLCSSLTNNATNWLFYLVAKDLDTGDYFWIKDFAFEGQAAGPFFSQKECVAAVSGEVMPPMKPMPAAASASGEFTEVFLTKNTLLKVM